MLVEEIVEKRYFVDCLLHSSYCYVSMDINKFLERTGCSEKTFNLIIEDLSKNSI